MESKTFILTQTKTFRHITHVFIKREGNKLDKRQIVFTTENKIQPRQRNTGARKIAAEFTTSDEVIYDALLRSHAYGKKFILKGDPQGKLKKEPFSITPVDAKKVALRNLFEAANLKFDETKTNDVLEEEYRIQMTSKTGVEIEESKASSIPHKEVNVAKELQDQADAARNAYKEKYGEEIPDEFANDTALLSAISDPDFDAKAYMEKNSTIIEETIEDLQKAYFDQEGTNVPNPKKNDKAWIKSKLAQKK